MSSLEIASLCQEVVRLVVAGGNILRASVLEGGDGLAYHIKSSQGDVVTALDRELEALLARNLRRLLAGSTVLGEERGLQRRSSRVWVIDPIDGSTNVVHGVRHAALSVALCVDWIPVLGVVHNPFTARTYYATAGAGAFVHLGELGVVQQLNVSTHRDLAASLISFGLPYDRRKISQIFNAAAHVFARSQDLRRMGSAALDIVAVAAGKMEAHFELDLRIWDLAAASLVLTEAGGWLTSWSGGPIDWSAYDAKSTVLASNGLVHAELCATLAPFE